MGKSSRQNHGSSRFEIFNRFILLPTPFYKILALVISILTLVACGGGGGGSDDNDEVSLKLSDDSYHTFGNTLLAVGVPTDPSIAVRMTGSVLDNDTHDSGGILTVTDATSTSSATITMNADGSFDYLPAAGLVGVDTFSYEVSDGTDTASATVSINIDNRVWYVDNTGAGSEGTSANPFSTLMDAQLVAQSGDTIYITGDGSSNGMDQGLSFSESGITVLGAGVDLVIDGIELATSGIAPVLTNTTANVLSLDNTSNIFIAGLTIDASVADAVLISNASDITLQDIRIQNSGESAIEGTGETIGLNLSNVSITNSDVGDASTSDDAIFLQASASVTLNMSGGMIDGVPGNLGDGIVLLNADSSNPVDMELTIQGVDFSNIVQDAIKIDNENGLVDVLIGGSELALGNDFSDIGYRGIVIMSDGDPALLRTNSVIVENNMIASKQAAVQIRGIDDISQISVTNNTFESNDIAAVVSAIDLQHDFNAQSQARINDNNLVGNIASNGLRVRLYDGAELSLESNNNSLDTFNKGFAFAVRETTGLVSTSLDATITDNQLLNISPPDLAMQVVNYHANSDTCLDLRNNTAVADYEVAVIAGVFDLTTSSQAINITTGVITNTPDVCLLPAF